MLGFFRRNDDTNADMDIPSTAPRMWKVYSSDGNEGVPAVTTSSSFFYQRKDQEEQEEEPPPPYYARRGRSQRSTRLRVDAAGIVHGTNKYDDRADDDDDELYGRSRSRRMPGYGNRGPPPQQSFRCDHHPNHSNNDVHGYDHDDDMDISVDEILELKAISPDGSSVTTTASVRRYRHTMLVGSFCLLLAMVVALAVSIALSGQNKQEQRQNQLAMAAATGDSSNGGGGSNGGSNGKGSESESQSDSQRGDDDGGDDTGDDDDDGDGNDDNDSPMKPLSPLGPTRTPSSSPPSLQPPRPSPQPHLTDDEGSCKDYISINKDCFDRGDTITVEFNRCYPEKGDWIGMYPAWSDIDGQNLYPDYLYWAWTCGEYPCQGSELESPQLGTIQFEAQIDNGDFQFHLISGSVNPYYSVAVSDKFIIKKSC